MISYTGTLCPVCDKKFQENEDIVVCPICGAPHHRHCYEEEGQCAFEEEHISGKSWKPEISGGGNQETYDSRSPEEVGDFCIDPKDGKYWEGTGVDAKTCTYCGSKNPKDNLYCCSCGNRLVSTNSGSLQGIPPFFGNFSNMDPVAAIYGGVLPTEKIGENTAQEMATFVGRSSNHFLPRFKVLSMNEDKFKLDFNFPAFIFGFLYFFYRKMYKIGLVILALTIALSIPSYIYTKNTLPEIIVTAYGSDALEQEGLDVEEYLDSVDKTRRGEEQWILQIFRVITTMFRMTMGIFANFLYYKFAQGKINDIKNKRENGEDSSTNGTGFDVPLYEAGGISWTGVIIVLVVMIVAMVFLGNYLTNYIALAIHNFPIKY